MTSIHRRTLRAVGAPLLAAHALALPPVPPRLAVVTPLLAALALALPAVAHGAPVLLMGPGGHVIATQDPFVPPAAPTPAPPAPPRRARPRPDARPPAVARTAAQAQAQAQA